MLRRLTDKDLKLLSEFLNSNDIKSNVLSKYSINFNLLCRESYLRPLLFEGNFLFYGDIKENMLINLAMATLPPLESKSAVLDISILSIDNEFIKYFVEEIKKRKEEYDVRKIRIVLLNDIQTCKKLLELGFYKESTIETNIGIKYSVVALLN